ncbi:MAG TPA: PDZ domain-containing protein [Acidimicrobiales bacterium]|nr:PDZ domain-containing protein [Acidimicrobiales bacterium]
MQLEGISTEGDDEQAIPSGGPRRQLTKTLRALRGVPLLAKLFFGLIGLVIILWIGSAIYLHEHPYYAISPGDAISVQGLITVPKGAAHKSTNRVLLTDVLLGQVTALQLPGYLLDPYVDLEPAQNVLGPNISPQELAVISQFQMSQSQDQAKIAALTHLGYVINSRGSGVLVLTATPGTAASSVFQPDDVITAVDGKPITAVDELKNIISTMHPEDSVSVTFVRGVDGQPRTVKVRLTSEKIGSHIETVIGVEVDPTAVQTYSLPVNISINSDQIGGPSAGLAFTLGVIDTLSNGNLTGGLAIAATGTIDESGNVGAIGGLPQKTVAVRRAGATVFFVPYGEPQSDYSLAAKFASGKVKIVKVHNVTDVLKYLAAHGGDLQGVSIKPANQPSISTSKSG